jgi:hypothetical protein
MTVDDSPLAEYRTTNRAGFAWNMRDAHNRWFLEVDAAAGMHLDGLLAVEGAIEELRLALEFAVDQSYGDPVAV